MKLPRLTAAASAGATMPAMPIGLDWPAMPAGPAVPGPNQVHPMDVRPMIDIGCLERCVGPSARSCARCGGDLSCWTSCAGPLAASCIRGCIAGG